MSVVYVFWNWAHDPIFDYKIISPPGLGLGVACVSAGVMGNPTGSPMNKAKTAPSRTGW
jgi:hypothetical protein